MTQVALLHRPPPQTAPAKLPPIATADLCTEFYNEPRLHDLLLAERLGFKRNYDIRELITRNRAELETYGALVRQDGMNGGAAINPCGTEKTATRRRGRPTKEYWLNEGQALTICALARTTAAARIRRELVTVFMAFRHGEPVAPVHIDPDTASLDEIGRTLAAMKAEIASLRRAVASSVEITREQGRALIEASGPRKRLKGPRPASSIRPKAAIIWGAEAVGDYVGLPTRTTYGLHSSGLIPTFKVGGKICSTTAALDDWLTGHVSKIGGQG